MAGMQDAHKMAFFSVTIFNFLTLPLFLGVATGQAYSALDFLVLEHCILEFSHTFFVASADMSHVNDRMGILKKKIVRNSVCISLYMQRRVKNVIR